MSPALVGSLVIVLTRYRNTITFLIAVVAVWWSGLKWYLRGRLGVYKTDNTAVSVLKLFDLATGYYQCRLGSPKGRVHQYLHRTKLGFKSKRVSNHGVDGGYTYHCVAGECLA